jgi:hypothetical protein
MVDAVADRAAVRNPVVLVGAAEVEICNGWYEFNTTRKRPEDLRELLREARVTKLKRS